MIKTYVKQAWELLKQNKLFSTLYIVGTGLAIATTMIMAIVYYVKIASIYPEEQRGHIFYMDRSCFKNKNIDGFQNMWGYSLQALKDWFYPLKNAEAVSALYDNTYSSQEYYIQPFDGSGDFPVVVTETDPGFFRVYSFRFLEGQAFTEADLQSRIRSVVITDALAHRIFGTAEGVTGKNFKMKNLDFRVSGVVKAPCFLTPRSFAQVYAPYSLKEGYDRASSNEIPYFGGFKVLIRTASDKQAEALKQEIEELARKFTAGSDAWKWDLMGQPRSHLQSVFQTNPGGEFSWSDVIRHYLVVVLVLLLVPALNLSGMIAGRMEMRLPEMGIRKSFGANRGVLLKQVLGENLLLTLIGGLLGLLLAWMSLYVFRDWLFALFDDSPVVPLEGVSIEISAEMLLAPAVFIVALLVCMILNLLSALIPAWWSLRNPIMKSLNEKK